jgi:hypothetical protein
LHTGHVRGLGQFCSNQRLAAVLSTKPVSTAFF